MLYIDEKNISIGPYYNWFDETMISLDAFKELKPLQRVKFLHREDDDPAYIGPNLCIWYQHGLMHRLNGPAFINYIGRKIEHFFLFDIELPEASFDEAKKYLEENGQIAFTMKYKGVYD